MTQFVHGSAAESNRRSDKSSGDLFWRDFLTALFPSNTAACVASFTRTSVRAAEHVLSGRNSLGGAALANLLRSPVGAEVVDALAGDVEWRAAERRRIELAELMRAQEQQRRLLDRLDQEAGS